MGKYSYYDAAMRQIEAGMAADRHTRLGAVTHSVDWAGRCERPVVFAKVHRVDVDDPRKGSIDIADVTPSLHVETTVPCRSCPTCLRRRAYAWRERGIVEWHRATRVWMGTLTVSPQVRAKNKWLAYARCSSRSVDFDGLNEDNQFGELCRSLGVQLTLFLKRCRYYADGGLRYLCVFERHGDGEPHVHLMIYERGAGAVITKRELEGLWQHNGFSSWRVCHSIGAIGYVTKYVLKERSTRIRASLKFGAMDRGSLILPKQSVLAVCSTRERTTQKSDSDFDCITGIKEASYG